MAFFDTTSELLTASDFVKQIPRSIHQTQENYDFVALYDQWRNGNLRLRCQSIMSSLVIHSNGDVPLCQNLDVVLGNIHLQTLDEIFNGSQACQTQCQYSMNCNGCWINFHRKYDIILVRNLERLLPKRLIEMFYGPYQWTNDPHTTYHQYFKNK
jgi:MoaA/NifB/PqqE/SkfB family radical SAM enzyme